ncbi:hypothetical protein H0H92_010699, partial [Tricholoma furcatifolium]
YLERLQGPANIPYPTQPVPPVVHMGHPAGGVKKLKITINKLSEDVVSKLQLPFTPDPWQIHLIPRIQQGYDCIFVAGTGYGKSLIFEGLAATGGAEKTLVIISPLKALERDQVGQASQKGLKAIHINEDNTKTAALWKEAKTTAQMIYISPEMALSPSFIKLWKDAKFRKRVQAVIVDEAHCIDEWGEEFRPNTNFSGFSICCIPESVRSLVLTRSIGSVMRRSLSSRTMLHA